MEKFSIIEGLLGSRRMVGSFDFESMKQPDSLLSFSLVVKIALLSPDDGGLCTDEEASDLNKFEDCLGNKLSCVKHRFVGRVTFDGHRELYYYIDNQDRASEILENLRAEDDVYSFGYELSHDPEWLNAKGYEPKGGL